MSSAPLTVSRQVVAPGDLVTCPKCGAAIARITRRIFEHETFGLDAVSFLPGQRTLEGAAACRGCGTGYSDTEHTLARGRQLRIHTSKGWQPPENKPDEPPSRIVRMTDPPLRD